MTTRSQTHTELIPYAPTRQEAKGLVAPIMRANGHITFLLAVTAWVTNSTPPLPATTMPVEDQQKELDHAAAHLAPANLAVCDTISTAARSAVENFKLGVIAAKEDWSKWTAAERIASLTDLAHRAAAIGSVLDRELAGLPRDSIDPGIQI